MTRQELANILQNCVVLSGDCPRYPNAVKGETGWLFELLAEYHPLMVVGKYGTEEKSLIVPGLDTRSALMIAQLFGQESVLIMNGGHSTLLQYDGTVLAEGDGVVWYDTQPQDFYTKVVDLYFQANLKWSE